MSKPGSPNVPKIFIDDDLLSAASQIFPSKFSFNEIDQETALNDVKTTLLKRHPTGTNLKTSNVNQPLINDPKTSFFDRRPTFFDQMSLLGLESIRRPMWNRPKLGQIRRRNHHFRPNRYEQSLQGWRQIPPFDEPEGQGLPPPHRQRGFRFLQGPQSRFLPRQEHIHPLENFDSFETFETSPPPPLHPPPFNHRQQRFLEQQQQHQPLNDDYVEQQQQPQQQQPEDYPDQPQDYPPATEPQPYHQPVTTSSRD